MKILFYFNSNSLFYTGLYDSIKKGFEEIGCLVEGAPIILNSNDLNRKILEFKPDFVLEVNRTKSEIDNFPSNLLHIGWLFDLWDKNPKDLYSDILYTFGYSWLNRFPNSCAKHLACLPPATDESIFKKVKIKKKYDFSFFGHIPKPWNHEELNRIVGYKNSIPIYFKDILSNMESAVLSFDNKFCFTSFQEKFEFKFSTKLSNSLKYDLTTRIFRQKNRMNFLNLIKKTSDSISIFGTNWEHYKEFDIYFKGYINSPNNLNKTIQESKVMLHDNHNLHFRVLDAMACGTPVTITTPKKNNDNLEIFGLKKNIHYLEVNLLKSEKFQIPSDEILNKISNNASKVIQEKHLWRHRAKTILNDTKKLLEKDNL